VEKDQIVKIWKIKENNIFEETHLFVISFGGDLLKERNRNYVKNL
jgi:hypothetical protein